MLIAFCGCFYNHVAAQDGRDCAVNATVRTENISSRDGIIGKATVQVQDGKAPFTYIFYDNNTGKQLQKDFSKSSIENLKSGSYYCIVADSRGCIKKIQFQIQ
jgi:hypothetical protein